MKSPDTRGPFGAAVGTVALASILNPLNTSMLAVALPQVQREFGTSAGAAMWLHSLSGRRGAPANDPRARALEPPTPDGVARHRGDDRQSRRRGVFLETMGWRPIFLMNLLITVAGVLLVLSQFTGDRVRDRGDRGAVAGFRAPARRAPLVSVYARFAAACTVFFAAFFALPLWLDQFRGLTPVATGATLFPMVLVSALATAVAIRVSQSGIPRTLAWGASGLCLGTALLTTMDAQTPMVVPVVAMVALGAAHAFNNISLQAELSEVTSPKRFGTTAGFFQTAPFVGAGLATGLLGIMVADAPTTDRVSAVDRDRAPERRFARVGHWLVEEDGKSFDHERVAYWSARRTLRRCRLALAGLRALHVDLMAPFRP
jgi:hypothetical protein